MEQNPANESQMETDLTLHDKVFYETTCGRVQLSLKHNEENHKPTRFFFF